MVLSIIVLLLWVEHLLRFDMLVHGIFYNMTECKNCKQNSTRKTHSYEVLSPHYLKY